MPSTTDERLTQRAMAAYFRSGGFDQPAHGGNVLEHDGKLYVVLSNIKRTLAVYRARPSDGVLHRLKRWPAEVADA